MLNQVSCTHNICHLGELYEHWKPRFEQEMQKTIDFFSQSLKNGCQAIISLHDLTIKAPGAKDQVFRLHYRSGNSGSFAEVKWKTLEKYPTMAATGLWTLDEFLQEANHIRKTEDLPPMPKEIRKLKGASQLLKEHHVWFRDYVNITNYLGGLRTVITGPNQHYELRTAFSGASQEEDLFMAIRMMQISNTIISDYHQVGLEPQLEALRQHPTINFQLQLASHFQI